MKSKGNFSDAEHRKHCKRAGCKHTAIYVVREFTVQGWCDLCRAVAFEPKTKKQKVEPQEFNNPFEQARRIYRKPPGSRGRWP